MRMLFIIPCAVRWRSGDFEQREKLDKCQLLVAWIFAVVMLVLFWRCFYSVNYGDEPYCISSIWRFYKGDALLAEDWFPALLYTFCVQLTTNTGILAVTSACIVASVGGVLLLGEVLVETKQVLGKTVYQTVWFLLVALLVLQGSLLLYHRITATWWSDSLKECTELLKDGPAKGIYTSPEDAEEYYHALENIDLIQLDEEDKVLFLGLDPMMYLYADLPVAAYSTWTIEEKNFLREYYEAYPEKKPTVVCWTEAESEEDAVEIQYFLDKGYERIETNEVIALRKK